MRKQLSILLSACLLLGACAAPAGSTAETKVQESTAAANEAAVDASDNASAREAGEEAADSASDNAAADENATGSEEAGAVGDQAEEAGAESEGKADASDKAFGSAGNAAAGSDETGTAAGTNALEDASAYAGSIDNSSIDASIYLDYSAGIEAGVYKWIKSEDGSYYTLAFIDENGEPVTGAEAAINVILLYGIKPLSDTVPGKMHA